MDILDRPSHTHESSSSHSQRRSYSSTSVEEKPSTSRSIESTSTSTIKVESDTKKRSQSFNRPVLRSVVPDSQLISLARRPVQSGRGKSILILSHVFFFHIYFSWSTN